MEYFVISAKFVPLKYYTLSSQLQRLTSFSVGCSGWRILSPGQIAVMRKWSIKAVFKLWINVVLVSKLRKAWSSKILMLFLSSLDNLPKDAYYHFSKGVDYFEIEHKTCLFPS